MKVLFASAAAAALLTATPAFAQVSDSDNASASANIVAPISIVKDVDLSFGNLVSPAAATTVSMAANGSLTGGLAVPGGTNGTPASFTVTGAGYAYSATLTSATIQLAGPGAPMDLDLIIDGADSGRTGLIGDGTDTLVVHGDLDVGANQMVGSYTGSFTVNVAYD